MKSWEDYKNYVKNISPERKEEMERIEELSMIIGTIIEQRNMLGLSQRDLADLCNMPQSSIARIETFRITPNLDTLLKILHPLGLRLQVSPAEELRVR